MGTGLGDADRIDGGECTPGAVCSVVLLLLFSRHFSVFVFSPVPSLGCPLLWGGGDELFLVGTYCCPWMFLGFLWSEEVLLREWCLLR